MLTQVMRGMLTWRFSESVTVDYGARRTLNDLVAAYPYGASLDSVMQGLEDLAKAESLASAVTYANEEAFKESHGIKSFLNPDDMRHYSNEMMYFVSRKIPELIYIRSENDLTNAINVVKSFSQNIKEDINNGNLDIDIEVFQSRISTYLEPLEKQSFGLRNKNFVLFSKNEMNG